MKSRLTLFVAAAMVAGPLAGMILHSWLGESQAATSTAANLSLVTTAFLHLIKMIIAPLIFATLSVGIARMENASSIARVGAKTLGWFIFASMVSMSIGVLIANLFKPGVGVAHVLPAAAATIAQPSVTSPGLKDILDHIIPTSVIQAMATNEILQIVLFSVLFGLAAASVGEHARRLIDTIEELGAVILRMTGYIMALAPLAVFAALCSTVMTQGIGILATYAKFVASFYFALLILWSLLLFAAFTVVRGRALELIREIRSPVLIAFSTASSEAAYPRTLESLERFGVSPRIASFVLPLGYSFNLDGSMMYCSFAILFIAQAFGISLGAQQTLVMLLVLMVTSKGMAAVPRASLMVIASTLSYFGLPEEGLVMIVAVDHLLDMGRSGTNVVGNAVASVLVSRWEGELRGPAAPPTPVAEPG